MQNKLTPTKNSLDRRGTIKAIPYYFSEKLRRKFELLSMSKAAFVDAPSGYGKTTAMRDYLKDADAHGEAVFWYTALDEAPAAQYQRFCREIEKIDARAGSKLLKIDIPNAFTIGEACETLRSIECKRRTWLVIDDFHNMSNSIPVQALKTLLGHSCDDLRIVLITQSLHSEIIAALAGLRIAHIRASDMQWDARDIRKYFSSAGIEISLDTAAEIEKHTNGWVMAVHLQLCVWRETGALSDKAVYQLMENLIWGKMTSAQQTFCMIASPLKSYSVSQLCVLLGCEELPEYAAEALAIPFIRQTADQTYYEAHEILHELVTAKRREMGQDFDRECIKKVGNLCRDEGKIAQALEFYAQIKDYESILSLNLANHIYTEFGNSTFCDLALDIARHCPTEIKRKYPLSMLYIAWAIRLMDDEGTDFAIIMDKLNEIFPDKGLLRAEWALLSVYLHFPKLEKMLVIVKEAAALFKGVGSRVILPDAPWAFYEYLQLTAFHLSVGEADREADMLEEFLSIYSTLTGGHGSGADALYRAELAFYRCDTAKAEIFAYKAAFLAENKSQKIIQVGAARLLSSIAIVKADVKGWKYALSAIEQAAHGSAHNTEVFRAVLDVVRGTLFAELNDFGRLAGWIKNADFMMRRMPISIKKNALAVHGLYLMSQGDFARLVGLCEARSFKNFTGFSEHFSSLLIAIGFSAMGDRSSSYKHLEVSAGMVLPDGMLHYFAGFSRFLDGLCDEMIERAFPEVMQKFSEYEGQYAAGWKSLRSAIVADEVSFGLTEREREIAELAADGLRNNEIADMLFVSENTVRAHLRAIYQKLDIDRRAKLVKVLK